MTTVQGIGSTKNLLVARLFGNLARRSPLESVEEHHSVHERSAKHFLVFYWSTLCNLHGRSVEISRTLPCVMFSARHGPKPSFLFVVVSCCLRSTFNETTYKPLLFAFASQTIDNDLKDM